VAGTATGAFLGASSARDAPTSRVPKDEKFFALELKWDFISLPSGVTIKTPWLDSPTIGGRSSTNATMKPSPAPQLIKPTQKIPKICTPADPDGDHAEADTRSAQIYSWLLWKQQQDAEKMNELLRKYAQPIQAKSGVRVSRTRSSHLKSVRSNRSSGARAAPQISPSGG
jgi:hypothetical protein